MDHGHPDMVFLSANAGRTTQPCRLLLAGLLLAGCASGRSNDDAKSTEAGGSSAASTASASTAAVGGSAATTTANGVGGATASVAGAGGGGGTGGNGSGCPNIPILDGVPATCVDVGAGAQALSDTSLCPDDTSVFWPAKVYEVPVSAGDCLYMQADNVGSPLGTDLFGAVVEPGGKSLLWDEEIPCSVSNPDGWLCPAGGATMEASGTAYVMVGMWEGAGCTPGDATAFELVVAINGVDVDLSSSAVCAGDLLEIIP